MKELGLHVLLDLAGCPSALLADRDRLARVLRDCAVASGATIVGEIFHRFSPSGVSGVLLIAESHLSIHTWPELGAATIDVYSCGEGFDPALAAQRLSEALEATETRLTRVRRGLTPAPQESPRS